MIRLVEVIWDVDLSFSEGFSRDLTFKNCHSIIKLVNLALEKLPIINVLNDYTGCLDNFSFMSLWTSLTRSRRLGLQTSGVSYAAALTSFFFLFPPLLIFSTASQRGMTVNTIVFYGMSQLSEFPKG